MPKFMKPEYGQITYSTCRNCLPQVLRCDLFFLRCPFFELDNDEITIRL